MSSQDTAILLSFRKYFLLFPFLLLAGCAIEVENPGKPDDSKPKPTETSAKSDTPSGQTSTSTGFLTRRASSVAAPTLDCSVVITRGSAGSSAKEGAVIALPAKDVTQGNLLVYRDAINDRFLNVTEQVFMTAPWSSGTYPFEYFQADGSGCKMQLTVDAADIGEKITLSVELTIPK